MIPFWLCGGGGIQVNFIELELSEIAVRLVGGPLGTVKGQEGNQGSLLKTIAKHTVLIHLNHSRS